MSLSVTQLDVPGKRISLSADFDVPLTGEEIADDARVRAAPENASSQPRIAARQMHAEA